MDQAIGIGPARTGPPDVGTSFRVDTVGLSAGEMAPRVADALKAARDAVAASESSRRAAAELFRRATQGMRPGRGEALRPDPETGIGFVQDERVRGDEAFAVPPQQTFAGIYQVAQRLYLARFDEAMRRGEVDALAMRRDAFVEGLLRHRILPSVGLSHVVETDDPEDPDQARFARDAERILDAIPRFLALKLALAEAAWSGKAGAQVRWGYKPVGGKRRLTVTKHTPVNGDKLVAGWDDYYCLLVHGGWRPANGEELVRTDRGQALRLRSPYYRDRFLVHEFTPFDPDYLFEPDMAQAVHGYGLRGRIYWAWWLRSEMLGMILDAAQKISANGQTIGYYDSGNAEQRDAVVQALKLLYQYNVIAMPRSQVNPGAPMIDHYGVGSVAYEVLLRIVDYLDDIIRLVFVGQNLSSESAATGLGSGVAELHRSMFEHYVRHDATLLAETLDEQLFRRLIRFNTWTYRGRTYKGEIPFDAHFRFRLDQENVLQAIATAQGLAALGIEFDRDELREKTGFSAPKSPAAAVGGAAPGGPQGQAGKPGNATGGPPKPPSLEQAAEAEARKARYRRDRAEDPGVMVALALPEALAADLALPGGEPAGELHVTLAYLGRASSLPEGGLGVLRWAVEGLARTHGPLEGEIGGLGRFSASPTSDGQDVLYASVDLPGLPAFRQRLVDLLAMLGLPARSDHGFTPHVTLAYLHPSAESPLRRVEPRPVRFGDVVVAVGGDWRRFPLGGPSEAPPPGEGTPGGVYQEEPDSTFTHDGSVYDLNAVLRAVAGRTVYAMPVETLKWAMGRGPLDPERVRRADTTAPVLVARWEGRYVVVDGEHRLARAVDQGLEAIPARFVLRKDLDAARLGPAGADAGESGGPAVVRENRAVPSAAHPAPSVVGPAMSNPLHRAPSGPVAEPIRGY